MYVWPTIGIGISWLTTYSYSVVALIDPVDIGSRGERLGIIGLLIASVAVLLSGVAWLYTQNIKAWRKHHEDTIKTIMNEREETKRERKDERNELVAVLKECTVAMTNAAKSSEHVVLAVEQLRGIMLDIERASMTKGP